MGRVNVAETLTARLIGTVFVERGLLSESQIRVALEIQRETGQQLGQILVERFGVSRHELASVVAEQWAEFGRSGIGRPIRRRTSPGDGWGTSSSSAASSRPSSSSRRSRVSARPASGSARRSSRRGRSASSSSRARSRSRPRPSIRRPSRRRRRRGKRPRPPSSRSRRVSRSPRPWSSRRRERARASCRRGCPRASRGPGVGRDQPAHRCRAARVAAVVRLGRLRLDHDGVPAHPSHGRDSRGRRDGRHPGPRRAPRPPPRPLAALAGPAHLRLPRAARPARNRRSPASRRSSARAGRRGFPRPRRRGGRGRRGTSTPGRAARRGGERRRRPSSR